MRKLKFLCLTLFFLCTALLGQWTRLPLDLPGPALPGESIVRAAAQKVDPSQYVGSADCADCHINEHSHFTVTAHRKTLDASTNPDLRGCEACHGPARSHVEFQKKVQQLFKDGKDDEATAMTNDEAAVKASTLINLKELSATRSSAMCLKCHEGEQGRIEERFNFRRSEHMRHGVSCLDCHSSHSPKRTEYLLRDTEPNLCYTCHADQKPAFSKPFHHKVPEGAMKCSDCHNQHGSFAPKNLRQWGPNDQACVKCHTDKAGPFVFEHAPVKAEGCQSCHTPHGSTNPKMLKRNDIRLLCIECHSNTPGIPEEQGGIAPGTPTFHNLADIRFRNCTTCHVAIHGSNFNRTFYR
ncbi:MAG: DmsE family decaheme c-type cytochrome [Blastocatellales bacterium]|nr:DmsE family decaheme c-type cytochrome [Blastocatellales bacterium]